MSPQVTHDTLFDSLVHYHVHNLNASLPYISNGQIHNLKHAPLLEGQNENPYYKGLLLIYDGETILDKAREIILRKQTGIRETIHVPTLESFLSHLSSQPDDDGVFLYNTVNGTITKVKGELKNHEPNNETDLDYLLQQTLPTDFLSTDGHIPSYDAGNKTSIAMMVPRLLPQVKTAIIKRTAYGHLGMGKLAEFGPNGLTQELYFEHNPFHRGPYINEQHHIIGVHKEYQPQNNAPPQLKKVSYVYTNSNQSIHYAPRIVYNTPSLPVVPRAGASESFITV